MTLSQKELINLPVFTKSNLRLGYIIRFEIDEIEQRIIRYYIKTHQGIVGLFDQELIIIPKQVVMIDNTKMVVEDSVIKTTEKRGTQIINKDVVAAGG